MYRKQLLCPQLQQRKTELESLKKNINTVQLELNAANDIVQDAHVEIQSTLDGAGKKVDKNAMQIASSKMKVGLDRKKKLEMDLKELHAKKAKLL